MAPSYWKDIDKPDFPVTADTEGKIVDATEWNGTRLPGKCVVSPEMEMLDCYSGDDDADALDLIVEHWSENH